VFFVRRFMRGMGAAFVIVSAVNSTQIDNIVQAS
jgi:hypothetical protein